MLTTPPSSCFAAATPRASAFAQVAQARPAPPRPRGLDGAGPRAFDALTLLLLRTGRPPLTPARCPRAASSPSASPPLSTNGTNKRAPGFSCARPWAASVDRHALAPTLVRAAPLRRRASPHRPQDWSQAATVLGRLPHPLPQARAAGRADAQTRPRLHREGQLGPGRD